MFAGLSDLFADNRYNRINGRNIMKLKLKSPKERIAEQFRKLEWNELVGRGDFIEDGENGFKPWEGPTGFRADAFVTSIYRQTAAS
jgi:hypothetical protein